MDTRKSRQTRTTATRRQLMRAAEELFAQEGLARVSVRAIITQAGQKNESALHYHFGNREGLLAALHTERGSQIEQARQQILENLLQQHRTLGLREIAELMVRPAFQLAQCDRAFLNYLKVLSHLILFSSEKLTTLIAQTHRGDIDIVQEHLRRALPDWNNDLLLVRFENAARYGALAMSRHAREDSAFQGPAADFFLSDLIDTLASILKPEVSQNTLELFHQLDVPGAEKSR